jgi:hypothetical protein
MDVVDHEAGIIANAFAEFRQTKPGTLGPSESVDVRRAMGLSPPHAQLGRSLLMVV